MKSVDALHKVLATRLKCLGIFKDVKKKRDDIHSIKPTHISSSVKHYCGQRDMTWKEEEPDPHKGKMFINELWTQGQSNKISHASKL